jgi:hypothetical protein
MVATSLPAAVAEELAESRDRAGDRDDLAKRNS